MMKKNLSADGTAKPNDGNGSHTITNLSDERLAPAGKWAASSLILQRPIMTQDPSLARVEYFLTVFVMFITFRMNACGLGSITFVERYTRR